MAAEEREGPFIKFFPGDFMKDPCVQVLSFEARAVWLFMLFLMHESIRRGYLVTANGRQMTSKQLANALQISEARVSAALAEMEEAGTYSKTAESIIFCRRMARATELSEKRADAGSKGGAQAKPKQTASKPGANPQQPSDARVRSQKSEVRSQRTAAAAFETNGTIVEPLASEPPEAAAAASEVPENFPESTRTIREFFPATDRRMCERVVAAAQTTKPDATDAELREALIRTHAGKRQRTAALWLKTLPAFFEARDGPQQPAVCPECGGEGTVLSHEYDDQPASAWLDLPKSRTHVQCPRCRGDTLRKPVESELAELALAAKGAS